MARNADGDKGGHLHCHLRTSRPKPGPGTSRVPRNAPVIGAEQVAHQVLATTPVFRPCYRPVVTAGRAELRPGGSAGAPVPPASGLFAFEEVGQDVIAQGVGGSVKGSAPVEARHLLDKAPEVPGGVKGESIDPHSLPRRSGPLPRG